MDGKLNFHWPTGGYEGVPPPYEASGTTLKFELQPRTTIHAVISGVIQHTGPTSLQIIAARHIISYTGIDTIHASAGDYITGGAIIGMANTEGQLRLTVYQPINATHLFTPPTLADAPVTPVHQPPPTTTRPTFLTPINDGLRMRQNPTDGKPIGTLRLDEIVASLESDEETHIKLGVHDQWLRIRREDGSEGYVAAWLLQKTGAVPVTRLQETRHSLLGMHLDVYHPAGTPDPVVMQGIGWIRMHFNVAYNPETNTVGNKDIAAAFWRYKTHLERYVKAGMKVLMVFDHHLYGVGAGYLWEDMDSAQWQNLTVTFADLAHHAARKFTDAGLVHAYQIWNEQDAPPGQHYTGIGIPAHDYAHLLTHTIQAIRKVTPHVPIITGGHISGPYEGAAYARKTLDAMPADTRPDGIAVHPYGRGMQGHTFSYTGLLSEEIDQYSMVLPGKPLWITEWGVLNLHDDEAIPEVLSYANGFMDIVREDYPGQIVACIWHAWADSMGQGFGLADAKGHPKLGFSRKWRKLG